MCVWLCVCVCVCGCVPAPFHPFAGRAIRHREDYAAILLVDSRYSKPTVRSKLPSWILRNALDGDSYGAAHRALAAFFRGKH